MFICLGISYRAFDKVLLEVPHQGTSDEYLLLVVEKKKKTFLSGYPSCLELCSCVEIAKTIHCLLRQILRINVVYIVSFSKTKTSALFQNTLEMSLLWHVILQAVMVYVTCLVLKMIKWFLHQHQDTSHVEFLVCTTGRCHIRHWFFQHALVSIIQDG